ncbi:MAG: PAC2 family protein [Deltaproteobacteria bacterium]|nr:PAC2 family protein [Deltaproteobacteria bacterium]MBW2199282.1 PAC2 family protein [Deltaproteobacteria bacterium]
MTEHGIDIEKLPELNKPLLIAGFDGWGNALDISKGMVTHLIHKLQAEPFAKIDPDTFYHYDETRPRVNIEEGVLKSFLPPGGTFYAVPSRSGEKDLVILEANEPNLRWFQFVDALLALCEKLGVETIITLGSMYDSVLHSDRIISGIASSENDLTKLKQKNVIPIHYQGPSAIHSIIHSESPPKGVHSISLWCHCPYYLQGITHLGLLATLGDLLSFLGDFKLNTEDLETGWKVLKVKIQGFIENNPELQTVINELRKAKVKGSWANVAGSIKKDEKVINIKDFLEPR